MFGRTKQATGSPQQTAAPRGCGACKGSGQGKTVYTGRGRRGDEHYTAACETCRGSGRQ